MVKRRSRNEGDEVRAIPVAIFRFIAASIESDLFGRCHWSKLICTEGDMHGKSATRQGRAGKAPQRPSVFGPIGLFPVQRSQFPAVCFACRDFSLRPVSLHPDYAPARRSQEQPRRVSVALIRKPRRTGAEVFHQKDSTRSTPQEMLQTNVPSPNGFVGEQTATNPRGRICPAEVVGVDRGC